MPTLNRREFVRLGAGAALGALGCVASDGTRKEQPPNLLFVIADQWRRQALGFMNEDPVITPHLNRFARESLVFDNAITCCPACTPSRASMWTGRYPATIGVMENDVRLPVEEVTIAEALRDAGYATGYIGKWHLDGGDRLGFTPPGPRRQGFEFWHANECTHRHFDLFYYRDDPEPITGKGWQPDHETDVAVEFIEARKDKPFALFLSWAPPHTIEGDYEDYNGDGFAFVAPDRFEALYRDKDLPRRPNVPNNHAWEDQPGYYGAITSLDENFGRLMAYLDRVGLADNTVVVFTSDHGEMLGSHGRMTKSVWFEESIGIPFIVRWPGRVPPGREELILSSVDMMPSLLSLMGQPIPNAVQGRDYSAALCGGEVEPPTSALIHIFAIGRAMSRWGWRGLRTPQYTYTVYIGKGVRHEALYDNVADPYQRKPQTNTDPGKSISPALWDELVGWLEKTNDPLLPEFKRCQERTA